MKNIFTALLLLTSSFSFSQEKISFLSSETKLVNTLPFYTETKLSAYKTPKQNNINLSKGQNLLYFDRQNKPTTAEKAYYFRKIEFNQNQIPVGLVEDFYSRTNMPKFSGNYYFYNNEDEITNDSYQGECTFYALNGEKTISKYVDGKITESKIYLASGKLRKVEFFNNNKTRKSFSEILFDFNENEIGNIIGNYNPTLKLEQSRKLVTDKNGIYESITEYEGNCPKMLVTKYKEGGVDYPSYIQDFTCRPNDWTFKNSQDFNITHNESEKYFEVNSNIASEGFLFTPILSDFSSKKFEIITTFQKSKNENIKEIGMVWQYLNENNYNYFVINLEKKTFEINSKINGEVSLYMIGIKNKIQIDDSQTTYTLKLAADPINKKFSYFVDDKEIQGFNKIPSNPTSSFKNLNIGFKFRTAKANESINLKKIEVKLL
jgi:hypothetical protein